ncbi:hypothetical protein BJI67_00045 [Acidihalobacter aeolianus]|uniref:EamA domain-containing protein n=2 Tax=Acidihalobacter aeolianus TaxID=2792603 RepID=A0A1D8KBL1_9GAMM|nr:hypothetical protein BJI67_00045 [Acidihalobacter aeolianus]
MAILWGGTFVSGRLLAGHVEPLAAAFLRFSIASVCLLVLAYFFEGGLPRLTARQFAGVILLGTTGVFLYNIFFFRALESLPAARAAAVIAMNPTLIAVFSWLLLHEALGRIRILGILLSLFGALIVIAHGDPAALASGFPAGFLDILACLFSWVAYSLIGRQLMSGLSPMASVTYSSIVGCLMLSVPALYNGLLEHIHAYTAVDWANLTYLGAAATALGLVWYYQGIKRVGAMRASIFINIVPVSALITAHIALGERIDGSLLLGGSMVVLGVYLTNLGLNFPIRILRARINTGTDFSESAD